MPLSALAVIDPSSFPGAATNPAAGVWKNVIVRASVPTDALEREANAIVKAVQAEKLPSSYMASGHRYVASTGIGLDPAVRATVRRTLSLLGASSILLLLLAIANLTNLTLVRSTVTSTATAIRFALGASRARVARAVFMDAIVLGAVGCAGALVLATLWARWYRSTQLDEHGAALQGLQLDGRVMMVSLGIAVLASTIAFLKPAFGARFRGLERQLRSGTNAPGASRLRMTLVAVQVALSVLLLVGAGLLGRTVANLRNIDLGFNPDGVLTLSMDPHLHGIEGSRLTEFATRFENELSRVDGVAAAGLISPAPLRSSYFTASMHRTASEPDPKDAAQRPVIGAGYYVSAGFLPAVGSRVIAGERAWRADSGTVVLTRSAAAALYPGVDPRNVAGSVFPFGSRKRLVRIAAVIEDVALSDITQDPPPAVFLPLSRRVAGLSMMAFVSAGRRPGRVSAAVQRAAAAVSSDIPVYDVRTARDAVDQQFAARVSMARAASTLGAIGLLLAVSGLYGVLAHLVAARRREFGVRAAMGATPRRILRDVIGGGLAPVLIGLLIGLAGAIGASRALRSQLFGLEPNDPMTYGFAVLALLAASLIACAIPALRSSRVSPAEALREL
jgi:predicted permease